MNTQERLDRLEETVFFQEKTIADLSSALAAQQSELDELKRRLADAEARLLEIARFLLENSSAGRSPEVPPHYL
jgi:SlyX protein